jgi:hypothetical protein
MWASRRHDSAMDIPRQHTLDQPWTPPESDETDSRHDYFNIYGTSTPRYPTATERRWLKEADRTSEQPSWVTDNFGFDSAIGLDTPPRPKPSSRLTEPLPYTPTRPCYVDASQPRAEGAPRYPYTPDSSRILRRSTELPSSTSSWDAFSEDSSSPVQNALSSCIAHFENLIQTTQPDEEQLEYIIAQFEAMAAHLSAPESQSKVTDEELFADAEPEQGLGIIGEDAQDETQASGGKGDLEGERLHHQVYVEEVGNYVAGVQKYILDLRMRMDEVKTLNSIQMDVINDLRKQMKIVRQGMRDELEHASERADEDMDATLADLSDPAQKCGHSGKEMAESWETLVEEEDLSREIHLEYSKLLRNTVEKLTSNPPPPHKWRVVTIVRRPPRRSFWTSFAEAVDAVSNLLLED